MIDFGNLDDLTLTLDALESMNQGFDADEFARCHKSRHQEKAFEAYSAAGFAAKTRGGYRKAHHFLSTLIEQSR